MPDVDGKRDNGMQVYDERFDAAYTELKSAPEPVDGQELGEMPLSVSAKDADEVAAWGTIRRNVRQGRMNAVVLHKCDQSSESTALPADWQCACGCVHRSRNDRTTVEAYVSQWRGLAYSAAPQTIPTLRLLVGYRLAGGFAGRSRKHSDDRPVERGSAIRHRAWVSILDLRDGERRALSAAVQPRQRIEPLSLSTPMDESGHTFNPADPRAIEGIDQAATSEAVANVRGAVGRLHPRYREVIRERFIVERHVVDVAEELGVTRQAVDQATRKGLAKLAKAIAGRANAAT